MPERPTLVTCHRCDGEGSGSSWQEMNCVVCGGGGKVAVRYERPAFSPQPKKAPKLIAKRKEQAKAKTDWRKVRKEVIARDGKQCRNCKHTKDLDLHHVVFRSLGGKDVAENLVLLCKFCHASVHGHVLKVRGADAKSVWFEVVG